MQLWWAAKYPHLGTEPLDISQLLDPALWSLERRNIFRHAWLPIARHEDLKNPGQYVCRAVEPVGTEIVVVRGRDGVLRAFHNMCSHRGNALLAKGCGRIDRLVCPFHAWSYRLDGSLAAITDEEQFPPFDRTRRGLVPIEVSEWRGFVFIRFEAGSGESLVQFMGECGSRLDKYPLEGMPQVASYSADLAVNWKVALDAFQEGYHVPFLHRRSAGRAYADTRHPFIHALHFELFDRHRMASYPGIIPANPSPLELIAASLSASVTQRSGSRGKYFGLNPCSAPDWAFDMFVFFPSFFIFAFEGFFFTYSFWPKSVNQTRFNLGIHFPRHTTAVEQWAQELAITSLRDTLLEDLQPMESIQRNIESGTRHDFILQDQELLIRHSHHVIRREAISQGDK